MVQINFAQKQVNAKIVYYGPGMSGKTTNLEVVHQRAPTANRGDLTSISTDGDRTLFFDFMPLDLGTVAGMRTCFQIYTVPGQVYYNSTRKLVLQGVDGVVFVADSSASMVQENLESLKNLEQNLNEYGKSLATLPHIIQFNKRDLPDAMTVDELNQLLNSHGAPCFEAIANTGQGVFPTLKALAARVLETIHTGSRPGTTGPQTAAALPAPLPAAAPAPAPAPVTAGSGTGYGQRPLHQTGYTQVAPGQAPASIPMHTRAPAPAPMPQQQQQQQQQHSIPMQRPQQQVQPIDPNTRTSVHAPLGSAPVGMPMQPVQQQQIVRGHPMPAPMPMAGPSAGAPPNLQMRPAAPMPTSMPQAPRAQAPAPRGPAPVRAPGPRPSQPRAAAPRITTTTGPKKKSFTTVMLVVAALVAGAVMAVAVLS
jgi:signal recognition particle receptor subunit beta